jgi:DNA-binding NtrC family response regulator
MQQNIDQMMSQRLSRAQLEVGKAYTKIKEVNGTVTEEDVGTFIRSYRMGSGDGMTLHWEFNNNGHMLTIDDAMWGSISGKELTYYRLK